MGSFGEVACSAASFSSFFIRANCCRSDIGVWFGTELIFLVVDVIDVGDVPVLSKVKIVIKLDEDEAVVACHLRYLEFDKV